MIPRFLARWLRRDTRSEFERQLDDNLARRRALRPARSAAASRGWETRRQRI